MTTATPLVTAQASALGVDLDQLAGTGAGGRITLADVRNAAAARRASAAPVAATSSAQAARDPETAALYARNPLADELQQQDPALYRVATQTAPAPTLFSSGDLPPFTASGIEVNLLLNVPWRARPALALIDVKSQALHAYNTWLSDPHLAEIEALSMSQEVREVLNDYSQRFRAWVRAAWAAQDAQQDEQGITATAQAFGALSPVFSRPVSEAWKKESERPRVSSGNPPWWTKPQ